MIGEPGSKSLPADPTALQLTAHASLQEELHNFPPDRAFPFLGKLCLEIVGWVNLEGLRGVSITGCQQLQPISLQAVVLRMNY